MKSRENNDIFQFINGVMITFGFTVMVFIPIALLVGDGAKEVSSLFAFGKVALSTASLIELLILAIIINLYSTILFSYRWIKNMPVFVRFVLFFSITILTIVVLIIRFHWFPVNYMEAWIGFFVSFAVCSTLGILIGRQKEKSENERMNKALEKYINDEKTSE